MGMDFSFLASRFHIHQLSWIQTAEKSVFAVLTAIYRGAVNRTQGGWAWLGALQWQ